jgi:hypothetical protein
MTHRPVVFLGSSSEAAWLARQVEGALGAFGTVAVDAWYHFGSWPSGASTLETLETRLRESDFAVLVLADDDLTQSRGAPARPAPRDNVIFELGLFMGRLGRDRAFFLHPASEDFKLPSDLFGITAFAYQIQERKLAQREISPICTRIVEQIDKVVHQQRVRGMQVRPRIELNTRFPADHGKIAPPWHAATDHVIVLKVRVSIDDDDITELRIYVDPLLNVSKSAWTYKEDDRGRYYWASRAQLKEMRTRGGFVSFDLERPRTGSRKVEVVAMAGAAPRHEKTFILNID